LEQVNPLRDLWEGASLEKRELPWTRKKGEKGKEEGEKRERDGRQRFGLLMERCPQLGCVMC